MTSEHQNRGLWRTSELIGGHVQAGDSRVGTVVDLLFDDRDWNVRWAVVDTGSWLPGRRVLLPPSAVNVAASSSKGLEVSLSEDQVKNCPSFMEDQPVSRQREAELGVYFSQMGFGAYGFPFVAGGAIPAPPVPLAAPVPDAGMPEEREGDPHLQSAKEVTGYHIHAADGEIGHVEELLVDPQSWTVPQFEVDTRNWWPGRKVVIAADEVKEISWDERCVYVVLSREQVKSSGGYSSGDR